LCTQYILSYSPLFQLIDYENDSDAEWEDDPSDAEECDSKDGDDEKENEVAQEYYLSSYSTSCALIQDEITDEDSTSDGWLVGDGYISSGEGEDENGNEEDPEARKSRINKMVRSSLCCTCFLSYSAVFFR